MSLGRTGINKRKAKMLVGKKYKVESDSMNVTVSEKKVNKKAGKEYWVSIAFFSTVKGALNYLVNLEVKNTELKDLKSVDKRIDELEVIIGGLKV